MAAKLFLGGIAPTTQKEDIEAHFGAYGQVIDAVVMYKDGRHRGFGFVTFADHESMHAALAEPQIIHERTIDVKPAVPSEEAPPPRANGGGCGPPAFGGFPPAYGGKLGGGFGGGYACAGYGGKLGPPMAALPGKGAGPSKGYSGSTDKVFIGGLAPTTTDDTLSAYFGRYGQLIDVVVMKDKITQKSRGFGFVRYDSPDPVEQVMADYSSHEIDGKWIEVKRAVPQDQMAGAVMPGFGLPGRGFAKGGYGAYGPFGGAGPCGGYGGYQPGCGAKGVRPY